MYDLPYNANVLTSTDPNSGPATIQHFSLLGAVENTLWTSALMTSNSLKAAMVSKIRTESRDTIVMYVTEAGAPVL